jgi:hypothetical protein
VRTLIATTGQPGFRLEASQPRRVAEDYLVSFETNRYSVPFRLIGHTVDVNRRADRIVISHRGAIVAEHPQLTAKYQMRVLPEHGPGAVARTARQRPSAPWATKERGAAPEVEVRDLAIYETLDLAAVSA